MRIECPAGTFGPNCRHLCRCQSPELCDPFNGHCENEQCQRGWFSGFNCQRRQCSNLKTSFIPDDTTCSRFYACFPSNPYAYLVTCPKNLQWVRNTSSCSVSSQTCQTVPYKEGDFVTAKNFYSFQNYLHTYYRTNTDCDIDHLQLDLGPHQYDGCPINILKPYRADINHRMRSEYRRYIEDRKISSKISNKSFFRYYHDRGYGIFRHDPNNCAFYHQCMYISGMFSHSTLKLCPDEFVETRLGSTMPDQADLCNAALHSENRFDTATNIRDLSEMIYSNINSYLSAQS
ncbi:hypothetical protein GJ496_009007 [Pomphorhynchus laevis]|nr:hypothetical protein GJ496_009007 [Pomphorhynchus laevis]